MYRVHDYVLFSGDVLAELTPPRVRQILRNIENCRVQKVCSKYFNSADKICILLGGKYTNPFEHLRHTRGNAMSVPYSKIIEQYFLRCETAFESLTENEKGFRKSFPPVDFIIRMCFVHHHWPGGDTFKFVQTPKNREIYARLFNLICDYWHWPRVIIPMTGNEVRLEDADAPAITLPVGVDKVDRTGKLGAAVRLVKIGETTPIVSTLSVSCVK